MLAAMRAMVLHEPAPVQTCPLRSDDIPSPHPGRGEIRVAVSYCGLCHTDLHTIEGELKLRRLPIVPGHQIVGIVDSLGAGVNGFREGDRVGVPWLYSTDGECAYCRRGQENLCDNARFTGLDANGGYAEQMVVSEQFACAIPSRFSDEHAAPLLCAGIIGYRSFRLSGAKPGDRLGLYGFGASAHIVIQFARHLGCEVYVYTRATAHQELASQLGAAWVGAAQEQAPAALDAAIIFAPAGGLVPLALAATRKGATVALAGITMSPLPQMDYGLVYEERLLRSVANSTRQDAREFLQLAAEVPVQTEIDVFALDNANDALRALKESRIRGAGVLKVS